MSFSKDKLLQIILLHYMFAIKLWRVLSALIPPNKPEDTCASRLIRAEASESLNPS